VDVAILPEGRDLNGTLISARIDIYGCLLPLNVSKSGSFSINGQSTPVIWDFLPITP
jgi:hypothetical protein